jgi:hypothetical protein
MELPLLPLNNGKNLAIALRLSGQRQSFAALSVSL